MRKPFIGCESKPLCKDASWFGKAVLFVLTDAKFLPDTFKDSEEEFWQSDTMMCTSCKRCWRTRLPGLDRTRSLSNWVVA